MINAKDIIPYTAFSVGHFVRSYMVDFNMTFMELSEKSEIELEELMRVVDDNAPKLTIENATKLGKVFETSAQFWLKTDNYYHNWLEEKTKSQVITMQCKYNDCNFAHVY
jgi:plasmid maintenance system antidote protein VapI